jgi:predicted nucleic acid-binding protein
MILIFDASAIIAFYSEKELNKPSLLHQLIEFGYSLVVPIAVVDEIRKGRKRTSSVLNTAIEEGKIAIYNSFLVNEISRFKKRYPKLAEGEAQVLVLGMKAMKEGKEYYCILDEGPATKIALEYKISKKGTIGLLSLLNDLGIIDEDEKENLLRMLKQSRFRVKNSHIRVDQ